MRIDRDRLKKDIVYFCKFIGLPKLTKHQVEILKYIEKNPEKRFTLFNEKKGLYFVKE